MANDDFLVDLGLQPPPFILVARNPNPVSGMDRTTTAVRFDSVSDATTWVERAEKAGRNIYIVRNRCVRGLLYRRQRDGQRYVARRWGNPPLVEDIEAIEWLVIDLDPTGTDTEAAFKHANQLLDRLPVRQHYRMFSGRGVQAAIRLANPAYSNDPTEFRQALELADRVNTWLRQEVDASLVTVDDVSNVNRFSRLCGTVNQKTGLRAKWIILPYRSAVVINPKCELQHVAPVRKRHWERVDCVDGLDPYVQEVIRETGRQPNDAETELLLQIGSSEVRGVALSLEFQHRATSGQNWAGKVDQDRSARIISFAATAIRAGEPIPAVLNALLDPRNEILNEHWLKPKSGRANPKRVVFRAIAKAILSIGLEPYGEGGDYARL